MAKDKKVIKIINNIKKEIKENGKYLWYMASSNGIKLISADRSKSAGKKFIYEKINKSKKYINTKFYLVNITTNRDAIDDESYMEAGPVAVHTDKYIINKKFKLESMDEIGIVWFNTDFLRKHKFKAKYINTILKMDNRDKIDISLTKRTIFDSHWIK